MQNNTDSRHSGAFPSLQYPGLRVTEKLTAFGPETKATIFTRKPLQATTPRNSQGFLFVRLRFCSVVRRYVPPHS